MRPYEVIFEDLAPELRFRREITTINSIVEHPVEALKEIFVAKKGKGEGLRFFSGGFWLDNERWLPRNDCIVLVINEKEIEKVYLYSNNGFFPLNDLVLENTLELPLYKAIRVSSEISLTTLSGFFPLKTKELMEQHLFGWVEGRQRINFIEAGYYRFHIFWQHGFSDAQNTKISDASIFFWRDDVSNILDSCILRIPTSAGVNYYLPSFTLHGYYVDKVEKSTTIGFRFELNQDIGGVPLTSENNDGSIRIIIEKIGGLYGGCVHNQRTV